jgi:hypothetical protein
MVQPDRHVVGEGLDTTGALHLVLGFEFEGHWVAYQLEPHTAVDLVHLFTDWLDRHSDTGGFADGETYS